MDARAETTHYVFGLEHGTLYTVEVNGEEVVHDELCGPGRTLIFQSEISTPVEIVGREDQTSDVGESAVSDPFTLEGPFPNPTRGSARLSIECPVDGEARMTFIDPTSGRRVHETKVDVSAGRNVLNAAVPSRLGSGCYLIRLEVAGRTMERKLIVAR